MENIYLPQNQPETRRKQLKQIAVIVAGLILLIISVSWLNNHSYIQVKLQGTINGEAQYELVEQKTKKTTTIKTNSPAIKKLVKKGSYEVLVRNQEASSLSVVSTQSFLKTTSISIRLQAEKSRAFVGDNPSPCMYFAQGQLFTSSCGANYASLAAHLPASAADPTTTTSPENVPPELPIGGIVELGGKNKILLNNVVGGEANEEPTRLYDLNPDLQLVNYTALDGLNPEQSYTLERYRQSFIVYDPSFEVFYYDNPSSPPQKIEVDAPENTELTGQQLSVDGERIAVAYSNPDRTLDSDVKTQSSRTEETVVQVYESGKTKSFSFDGSLYLAQVCGGKYLCLVQDRVLTVYDIAGDTAKKVVSLGNVYNVKTAGDKLVVVRYDGVFEFDTSKRIGYMQYSFGAYSPCGIETSSADGYVLCVINPKNDKTALYIDPRQENTGSIDKKILNILEQPYIDSASAYKSFIYIVPNLGSPVYNPESKGYASDPAIRQKTTSDINSLIDRLGIDSRLYTVINTNP